jgi:hypothetical protein
LPVSDTAPKIDDPIASKPIDTAAVTAPIDTAQAAEAAAETPKETGGAEASTTPSKEKKGGINFPFFKKDVKKADAAEKEENVAEPASKEAAAAATPDSPAPKADVAAAPATEDAKPADKRRSSVLGTLGGSFKKIAHNANATSDAAATDAGAKREKSPLPQRIGSLFRRPSKGVKSEESKEAAAGATDAAPATDATPAPVSKDDETAVTNGTAPTEAPAPAAAADVVPDAGPTAAADVTTTAPEVKAPA